MTHPLEGIVSIIHRSSSVGLITGDPSQRIRRGLTTPSQVSMEPTTSDSLKMYLPDDLVTREKKIVDIVKGKNTWKMTEAEMSEQHKAIFKLAFFTDNFQIRVLGLKQETHKWMGNVIFQCFLHPLENLATDYFDEASFLGNKTATVIRSLTETDQPNKPRVKEFIESEEDELRFTYKKAIKLYGMTLQVQLAADLSKDVYKAQAVAEKQIDKMCSYLAFKKRFCSGFGINSFLIMLEWEGTITHVQECLIKLCQVLFGTAVFDHMTFIVPVRDLSINWESAVDHIKDKISHLTGYEKQILKVLKILMIAEGEIKDHNMVSTVLDLFRSIGHQTYRDPAPFEPVGQEYYEAKRNIDHVKESYQLRAESWYHVVNSVYNMVPN